MNYKGKRALPVNFFIFGNKIPIQKLQQVKEKEKIEKVTEKEITISCSLIISSTSILSKSQEEQVKQINFHLKNLKSFYLETNSNTPKNKEKKRRRQKTNERTKRGLTGRVMKEA